MQESTVGVSLLRAKMAAPLTNMRLPAVLFPVSGSSAKLESLKQVMVSGPSGGSLSVASHSNLMP